MLVLGKGLGGGIFPLAALVARDDLNVAGERALGHYTHEKNPVACAAALETIRILQEEGVLEHVQALSARALARLQAMRHGHPSIGEVRGLGLLLGVELVRNRETGERAGAEAEAVLYCALAKGLSFKITMGNILTLTPPLTLTEPQLDLALDILEESLTEVERAGAAKV